MGLLRDKKDSMIWGFIRREIGCYKGGIGSYWTISYIIYELVALSMELTCPDENIYGGNETNNGPSRSGVAP